MQIVAVLFPSDPQLPPSLGSASGALGLRDFLAQRGVSYQVLDDTGPALDRLLPETDVLITTPFFPAYVTRERIENSPKLKLILTAGVGSDHIDLKAAAEHNITVAEITASNVSSVAEHAVMDILILVRNFVAAHQQAVNGEWNIAAITQNAHDLEGMKVGTVGAGRIGQRILLRLKYFGVQLYYYDHHRLSTVEEFTLGATYLPLTQLVETCNVITINTPLTPETDGLFDRDMLSRMPQGSYLVNTARGKIVQTEALVEALESGHLAGYAGDVWYPQPAPQDHPWRRMGKSAMVPHYSGATLEAQARYAAGVRQSLEAFLSGKPIETDYLIVAGGKVVSPSYRSAYL